MKALLVLIIYGCMELLTFSPSFAQQADGGGKPGQTQAKIILVDDLGIYVPGKVFYWDESQGKARIKKLQQLARGLMNKEVLLTYAARGDLGSDRRPMILDLEAAKSASASQTPTQKPSQELQNGSATASGERHNEPIPDPSTVKPPSKPSREPVQPEVELLDEQGVNETDGEQIKAQPSPGGPQSSDTQVQGERARNEPYEDKYEHYASTETASSASLSRDEITRFVKTLLNLNNNKAISSIMDCYADEVEYYTRGLVNKDYVRRDLGYYYKNWESISTALDGEVVVIVTDEKDVRVVKFLTTFYVKNAQKSVRGATENIWKIKKINGRLRLVGVKQHIVGSETLPP